MGGSRLAAALIVSDRRRLVLAFVVVAVAGALGLALAGQGNESHTPTELALQRKGLALVSRQLLSLQTSVEREVSASRAVWRSLATGMPAHVRSSLAAQTSTANAVAAAMPTPQFVEIRHELLGPAARIAALFHEFELLVQRGWAHVDQLDASLRNGLTQDARFERVNSGLYIDSIYDGNFDLSLIGERVLHSYERLGAAKTFRSSLTPAEVRSIAAAYSPSADRLRPHLWRQLLAKT
jgi:hypothetical protein